MRCLLDTHAFLWWLTDAPRLSATARAAIADEANVVFLSAASVWEMAIKQRLGRLEVGSGDLSEFVRQQVLINRFVLLPVQLSHAARVSTVPLHHRDPFDHLLIAQCQVEHLVFLSCDPFVSQYDVQVVW